MSKKLNRKHRVGKHTRFQFELLEPRHLFSVSPGNLGPALVQPGGEMNDIAVVHMTQPTSDEISIVQPFEVPEEPDEIEATGNIVQPSAETPLNNFLYQPMILPLENMNTQVSESLQLNGAWDVNIESNLSIQWSMLSGPGNAIFTDPTSANSTVEFDQAGTYELLFRVTNHAFAADTTLLVSVEAAEAGTPALPELFDTTYSLPTGGTTHYVNQGDDFQAALDVAQAGDVIVLEAGATFTGNFVLPNKGANSDWIYIISSDMDSLPEGSRVGPADAAHMPKIVSPNSNPALATKFGSNHYRLSGIEISTEAKNYNLVLTGYDGNSDISNRADDTSEMPYNITFDRCYLHSASDTNAARTGILANGKYFAVVDSYLSNFKDTADASAIQVWYGEGPYKFVNNFLEGSGENILIGGEQNPIGDIPSDFEIRGNHFYKRPEWQAPDRWKFKNLFEIKCAQRVIFTGNVLEYSWVDGQKGDAIVLTPRNDGNPGDQRRIWDITIENNIIRHVGRGFNIAGEDNFGPTQPTQRILINNNLMTDVNTDYYGNTRFFNLITPEAPIEYLTITNNTMLHADGQLGNSVMFAESDLVNVDHIVIENNIFTHGDYGIPKFHRDNRMTNLSHTSNGYAFLDDWSGYTDYYADAFAGLYPGNFKTDTIGGIGFVDAPQGDYHLAPSSPFKNAGTDGKDLGADINLLKAATGNAMTGTSQSSLQSSTPDGNTQSISSAPEDAIGDRIYDNALFRTALIATSNQGLMPKGNFQESHYRWEVEEEREENIKDKAFASYDSSLEYPMSWEETIHSHVEAATEEKFDSDVLSVSEAIEQSIQLVFENQVP